MKSPTWVGDDQRTRGVAVETVNLFENDWPLEPDAGREPRASVTLGGGSAGAAHLAGTPVSIVVANLGTSTWLSAADAPAEGTPVQLALRWRRAGTAGPIHEQRMDLPHTLYPTDRVLIEAKMVPPDALRLTGPWTVTISPVARRHADPAGARGHRGSHRGAPVTCAIHSTTRAL